MEWTNLFEQFEEDFKQLEIYDSSNILLVDKTIPLLKKVFNCIDLTSLNTTDCSNSIEVFSEKVVDFPINFPDMPNVAAVCVYPVFASVLDVKLKGLSVNRAVVSACFPSSQTFLDTMRFLQLKNKLAMLI